MNIVPMMSFDQTAQIQTRTLPEIGDTLAALRAWIQMIEMSNVCITINDINTLPYLRRGVALVSDLVTGTPNAQTSIYIANVSDNQIANILKQYIPSVAQNHEALVLNIPQSIAILNHYLNMYYPLVTVTPTESC